MSNEFWTDVNSTVELAEQVRLPKPHLTQPELVEEIEERMANLDEAQKAVVHRQVLTGVVEGRFSQYSALPFSHFATAKGENDKGPYTFNRAPEAKRLMAVIDAVIAEMSEDSEHRARNDAYTDAVASIRDENGKVNDNRLTQLILAADEAGEPFWTDSREFIHDGEVEGSNLTLADLVATGVLTVQQAGQGTKAFVAKSKDLAEAIDALEEAGFTAAAELLRGRTQRRRDKGGNRRQVGSGLASLAANTGDEKADDQPTYSTESDDNAPATVGDAVSDEVRAALGTDDEAATA